MEFTGQQIRLAKTDDTERDRHQQRHSLGLKTDGSIVAWGNGDLGQCDVPDPNTDYVAVAGGKWHSLG